MKPAASKAATPLREAWYYALPSRRVGRRELVGKMMLGEPILIGRDEAGGPFALRDLCPHRGMPLSAGHFDGREIECCYHGWRFDTHGQCTLIPSLVPGQSFSPGHIRTRRYPAHEIQGNVWVFFWRRPGNGTADPVSRRVR
ncbi:MAG: Rieske (2Fe-2S) protein [Acetobacteraceae bacterium]|nr:Rieske (2Fe-2S) protein [Acetobacteraceae bacterium]